MNHRKSSIPYLLFLLLLFMISLFYSAKPEETVEPIQVEIKTEQNKKTITNKIIKVND